MVRALTLSLALSTLLACGGSQPPPGPGTPGVPTDLDRIPDAASEAKENDAGSLVDAAPAAAPAPTETASTPSSPPDECTPIGVDFEKRVRPKFKDCYRDGKKKDPNLQGTVKIAIDIDTLGKIKSIKIIDKSLPDPVAQCMLKAVKTTPMPEASKCPGKGITLPVTFPTPP